MKNLFGEESETGVPTPEVATDPLAVVAKAAADKFSELTGKNAPLMLVWKQIIQAEKQELSPERFASRLSEELQPKMLEAIGQTAFAL